MLRRLGRTVGLMSTIVAIAGSLALAAAPPATLTVGDFLLLYAKSAHLVLPPDATPQAAQSALKAAKALPDLELSLDRALTHADVSRIGQAAGLKIVSSTPSRTLDRAEAELFLETFVRYIAPAGTGQDRLAASDNPPGNPGSRANTDKGKKKGRPFQSPTEP